MSPSATPMIPTASPASVFPQAVLENGYDHLRDHSSNGGYMNYGVRVEDMEPTYFPVRGWDQQTMLFVTHTLFSRMAFPSSPTLV